MKLSITLTLLAAAGMGAQTPTRPADPAAAGEAAAKGAVEKANQPPRPGGQATPATPRAQQATPISLLALPPEHVVAVVDGRNVTAGDLQAVLRSLAPQMQQAALGNRRQLVAQYGVARKLADDAEKAKLDQNSPWKEALINMRMQVLANAEINQKMTEMQVPAEEQQKYYESNKEKYVQAKVKAIRIPFGTVPASQANGQGKKLLTEPEAKAKVEEVAKQAHAGTDFAKLMQDNPSDPPGASEIHTINKADRIPDDVKNAVFAAKPGEITQPVRQPNAYYLFQVQEIGTQPFDQVKNLVSDELKNSRFTQWMASLEKSLNIQMKDEPAMQVSGEAVQPPSAPAPTLRK